MKDAWTAVVPEEDAEGEAEDAGEEAGRNLPTQIQSARPPRQVPGDFVRDAVDHAADGEGADAGRDDERDGRAQQRHEAGDEREGRGARPSALRPEGVDRWVDWVELAVELGLDAARGEQREEGDAAGAERTERHEAAVGPKERAPERQRAAQRAERAAEREQPARRARPKQAAPPRGRASPHDPRPAAAAAAVAVAVAVGVGVVVELRAHDHDLVAVFVFVEQVGVLVAVEPRLPERRRVEAEAEAEADRVGVERGAEVLGGGGHAVRAGAATLERRVELHRLGAELRDALEHLRRGEARHEQPAEDLRKPRVLERGELLRRRAGRVAHARQHARLAVEHAEARLAQRRARGGAHRRVHHRHVVAAEDGLHQPVVEHHRARAERVVEEEAEHCLGVPPERGRTVVLAGRRRALQLAQLRPDVARAPEDREPAEARAPVTVVPVVGQADVEAALRRQPAPPARRAAVGPLRQLGPADRARHVVGILPPSDAVGVERVAARQRPGAARRGMERAEADGAVVSAVGCHT